jgi:hypothetical protein
MKKVIWIALLAVSAPVVAQSSATPQTAPPPAEQQSAPSHGTVIFSRSDDQPASPTEHDVVAAASLIALSDSQRDAVTFTKYALDVHLTPADAALDVHARMTLRNDSDTPLPYLPLQISSTLQWESIEIDGKKLVAGRDWQQHALVADADHTGAVTEAVITLATPLAPGGSVEVTAIYSGNIAQSEERLERIGAPTDAASASEWDRITPEFTGLRGFGNVLWYPAAAPPLFLGDGARLFQQIGRMKLREAQTPFSLRLTVEYTGATPSAVFLNGESKTLTASGDEAIASDAGIPRAATVEFAAKPIGFQMPSLFVVQAPPMHDVASPLRAYTTHPELLAPYETAASQVLPLITDWLGAPPPLSLVALPEDTDTPFEAGSMLALGLRTTQPSDLTLPLAHALARAQLESGAAPPRAWMDEGLTQFIALLWIAQTHGREAAVDEMNQHGAALALVEPDLSAASEKSSDADAGQSLILATDEIYYRTKAADVWWMLRDIVGDTALQQALALYRAQVAQEKEPSLFQRLLEQTSKKDLEWFFDDWVYRDRGLPDLSIAAVVPREVLGKDEYLVAVEVANDGYAAAEVPVTVRAGSVAITERLLVPAHEHATRRILFEVRPEEVQVNDGSVPELRTTVHRKQIVIAEKK